jgi:predicted lipase
MVTCGSRVNVALSLSIPATLNVSVRPSTLRLYTTAEPQSGHQVVATGSAPNMSLTISWPSRRYIE